MVGRSGAGWSGFSLCPVTLLLQHLLAPSDHDFPFGPTPPHWPRLPSDPWDEVGNLPETSLINETPSNLVDLSLAGSLTLERTQPALTQVQVPIEGDPCVSNLVIGKKNVLMSFLSMLLPLLFSQ